MSLDVSVKVAAQKFHGTFAKHSSRTLRVLVCLFISAFAFSQQAPPDYTSILQYIHSDWDQLTRSMTRCDSIADPKVAAIPVLYFPADSPEPASVKDLAASCRVRVEPLPAVIHQPGQENVQNIEPDGLLFLPNPYVVPGGRFNEMYGWDSYFIILGLIQDGRLDLARGIVENFLFEIEHYGTVLNANRTYYLTRSQPPFLTPMILAVYTAEQAAGHADSKWLERAYTLASHDYEMWITPPHLAGQTGLSRYYDFGSGPAPEGLQDEVGLRRKVVGYFLMHPALASTYLVESKSVSDQGSAYSVQVCDPQKSDPAACDPAGNVSLVADYYKGDRSMRESGFDISFRFGAYGSATHHFAPTCLNSLLYKTETDLAAMARTLNKSAEAANWLARADRRKALINQYLWDAQHGLFFDYNFETGERSTYEFATTFYPLWAHLATQQQADAVIHNLGIFEQRGGLATSSTNSGVQWDYPYGWAPLEWLAVEGMRNYAYNAEANRVARKFLDTVFENYRREGTIREKYDVVTQSSDAPVAAGYRANVIGFGWTNGVFLDLLRKLPKETATPVR